MEESDALFPYRGLVAKLKQEGYIDFFVSPNGKLGCLAPYVYTWGILEDLSDIGYGKRWCYHSLVEADGAKRDWIESKSFEPKDYIRLISR